MIRLTKPLLSVALSLAFLARGAAAFCPPKAEAHGCCDKPAPAAPQTPCPEMACCQIAPATAAPALGHQADFVLALPAGPCLPVSARPSFIVFASSDSGPPGPRVQSVADRSPPALLG